MRIFLAIVFACQAHGFDIVVESLLRTVNKSMDPCDDFYRHACPLGSPNMILGDFIQATRKNASSELWNEIGLINDFEVEKVNFTIAAVQLYKTLCENGDDTVLFLSQLGRLIKKPTEHYSLDADCGKVAKMIDIQLNELVFYKLIKPEEDIKEFNKSLISYVEIAQAISLHLDNELESSIEDVNRVVEKIKEMAEKLIIETPWLNNNNVTDFTSATLKMTFLQNEYARILRDSYDYVMKFELEYRKCKQENGNYEEANSFCFLVSAKTFALKPPLTDYFNFDFNAFNGFPELAFGFPFYFMTKNVEEMAAKLGAVGFVVGHELGHTLIKGANDSVQTYFSQEATDCIWNQYNSTCNMFKEISCHVDESQNDENGADVFAGQMTYALLEEHYGSRLKDIYQPLNVTYQQLFFYSVTPFFCKGEPQETLYADKEKTKPDVHALGHIRVNALANLPGFKDAFQCSDDSRMIKSATKQCHIYGKDAPWNKKR